MRSSRCCPMVVAAAPACSYAVPLGIRHWMTWGFMSSMVLLRIPQSCLPVDSTASRIGVYSIDRVEVGKQNCKESTMSTIFDPVGNVFGFTCNCGFSRRVTDSEINFKCERPVVQANDKPCTFFYSMTKDGSSPGVPTVKRVNASGVDQSDNAVLVNSAGDGEGSLIGGASATDSGQDSVDAIQVDGTIG